MTFSSHLVTDVSIGLVHYFRERFSAPCQRGTGATQATLKTNIARQLNHCDNILY